MHSDLFFPGVVSGMPGLRLLHVASTTLLCPWQHLLMVPPVLTEFAMGVTEFLAVSLGQASQSLNLPGCKSALGEGNLG